MVHTTAPVFGKIMAMTEPSHAVAAPIERGALLRVVAGRGPEGLVIVLAVDAQGALPIGWPSLV